MENKKETIYQKCRREVETFENIYKHESLIIFYQYLLDLFSAKKSSMKEVDNGVSSVNLEEHIKKLKASLNRLTRRKNSLESEAAILKTENNKSIKEMSNPREVPKYITELFNDSNSWYEKEKQQEVLVIRQKALCAELAKVIKNYEEIAASETDESFKQIMLQVIANLETEKLQAEEKLTELSNEYYRIEKITIEKRKKSHIEFEKFVIKNPIKGE